VAIIGLLIAASALALQNVMRSELRSAASRTAAAMRFCFDRATMTGQHVRLVFDIEKGEIRFEASEDRVRLKSGSEQNVRSAKARERERERGDEEGEEEDPLESSAERRKRRKRPPLPLFAPTPEETVGEEGEEGEVDEEGMEPGIAVEDLLDEVDRDLAPVSRARARFKPLKGMFTKKIKLAKNVRIDGVITPRMAEPVEEGRAHIYFFPQGHSEPAIVHLIRLDTEDYYSVVLHPLTGQARVYPCMYRIPEEFGISDDKRGRRGGDPCVKQGGL
jgi:hypothetical protein